MQQHSSVCPSRQNLFGYPEENEDIEEEMEDIRAYEEMQRRRREREEMRNRNMLDVMDLMMRRPERRRVR